MRKEEKQRRKWPPWVEGTSIVNLVPIGLGITELHSYIYIKMAKFFPVNILTVLHFTPFSWAAQHTTVCLDPQPLHTLSLTVVLPWSILWMRFRNDCDIGISSYDWSFITKMYIITKLNCKCSIITLLDFSVALWQYFTCYKIYLFTEHATKLAYIKNLICLYV